MLSQLAAICRAEPARAKWVLVPSHSLGHTVAERFARESGSWLNVRFTTPADLAKETAAPHLVDAGVNPVGDDLGAPLVMRLLRDLPADVPSYFRALADQQAMGEALWSTIVELRLTGVGGSALKAGAFQNPAKHAELQALLGAHESWLTQERRADQAVIYQTALEHLADCPVRRGDVVLEVLETQWAPLVRQFIDGLPGEHPARQVPALPGVPLPRRLAGSRRDEQPAASPLARLMAPPDQQKTGPSANIAFFRAGGPEAEIEEVFRRILHAPGGARRLDEVEIACASSDSALLVWQKAARHEWPVTLEPGLPGAVTRPVRALLAWCDWIETGFAASTLRRMLASGDIRVDIEDGPGSGQSARLLLGAAPTWGRRTYTLALDALAVGERDKAEDAELADEERERHARRAAEAERLRDWIGNLLAAIPEPVNGDVPVQALVTAAINFVDRAAARTNDLDGHAAKAIQSALQRLRLLGDASCNLSTAMSMIRSPLGGIRVAAHRPKPGHLHVSTLAHAGLAGRPFTFIVGLQEGQVFPAPFEDPVLLDCERTLTHDALARSADRTDELVHGVLSRMAGLRGAGTSGEPAICLSYSCQDLRDGRRTFPSSLMLQAFRLTPPGREATFSDLVKALGEPVSQVPSSADAALADGGWWLANLRHAPKAGLERVHEAFPDRKRGMEAEAARESETLTEFDGLALSAGAVLDPRRSGGAISPTSLEKLATCPFAFFLKSGLGLEPIEEDERDVDEWLDALARGSFLHDLYAQMMRHLRAKKEKPSLSRHLPWLKERADAALAALRDEMPPPSEEVFDRERDDTYRDLEIFLKAEEKAAAAGVVPVGFEVGFAGRGEDEEEPLSQPDPVQVRLPGARFLLSGRIDRIDRLPGGAYQVADYKTGSLYWPKYHKVFRNGRLLQHALYGIAAESLLRKKQDPKAEVKSGRYSFPTAKGAGRSKVIARPSDADLGRVVEAVLDIAGGGAFTARADEKDKKQCEWCDFAGMCGGMPAVKQAAAKLRNAANTALQPYRRLQEDDNA